MQRASLFLLPVLILLTFSAGAAALASGCGGQQADTSGITGAGAGPATTPGSVICGEDIDYNGVEFISNPGFAGDLQGWRRIDAAQQPGAAGASTTPSIIVNGTATTGVSIGTPTTGTNLTQISDSQSCGNVLELTRDGSGNVIGLLGLQQDVTVNPKQLTRLKLQMVARIDEQLMNGDGNTGGDTPLFITIDYTTGSGDQRSWTHGLLMSGPVNYPDRDQLISPTYWYTYNVENILPMLPDAASVDTVTIGGSGWDFDSSIAYVSLRGM